MQDIVPQPIPAEEHAQELVIRLAISALECWGGDMDSAQAKRILPYWRYFSKLTPRMITRIVNSFPPPPANSIQS